MLLLQLGGTRTLPPRPTCPPRRQVERVGIQFSCFFIELLENRDYKEDSEDDKI